MNSKTSTILTFWLAVAVVSLMGGCQDMTGRQVDSVDSLQKVGPKIAVKAYPFDLRQVRLLDGPFKDAMQRDRKYLHELEADRLLHTFRINAALPSSAKPLGGWEEPGCELRGHTIGHYLSACALMYAGCGDEELKAKADGIVAELAKCQKVLGDSGYLSAYPQEWFDRLEACKRVWAPYYTIHKILAGMVDMYIYCGNEQALEVAEGMARWAKSRTDRLDPQHMQRMLNCNEQGGMNDVFANLYSLTGNPDHLELSLRFTQNSYVDPLSRRQDRLRGQHVNSFIPNMIGTARRYGLTANPRDRIAAEFFWDRVVNHRSYCTGGTSNMEYWRSDPDRLADQLSDFTQETCCTYNMLKLTRHLFSWSGDAAYADYYERALYNSILSTQNPDTGMMMYFVPLDTGRWKMFNLPNESFWCCTGTGLENHAKYGDSIYFHKDDTLFVNLFIASELNWSQKGVAIRQQTLFPERDSTELIVHTDKPAEIDMKVRVPYWATRGVYAKLNGKTIRVDAGPAGYFSVKRTWRDGDKLEIRLPMSLHTHPMPDDPAVVAFMYGPLVLAGMLSGEGLTEEAVHTTQNWYEFPEERVEVEPLLVESDEVTDWIKPVAGKRLTFQTATGPNQITLVPYHKLFGHRYIVYWQVFKKDSKAHKEYIACRKEHKAMLARIIDEVEIGDESSESRHNMQGENTDSGYYSGHYWRHATDGGWFSYTMKVLPGEPIFLQCTYWGGNRDRTIFDILVDGDKIATVSLNNDKPDKFERQYPIRADQTAGKEEVTVKFQAHPGSTASGVFGCRMLK